MAKWKSKDLESAVRKGPAARAGAMSWEQFVEVYTDEHLSGQRDTTREKGLAVFKVFDQEMSVRCLADITERTISKFVAALRSRPKRNGGDGLAAQTIHNYLVCLKTALKWAADQKLIVEVPKFPKVLVPKKKPQPIPQEWFDAILTVAPSPEWRAFLLCGWWAGLRLSEARFLRWSQSDTWPWLDLEGGRVNLPAEFAKSGEDQWLPLHPTLRAALESLPRDGDTVFPTIWPMSRTAITNKIGRMAKRAGVRLSMHRLRKGFGCRVAKQLGKGEAPVLHRLMRHSSMQITMDYYSSVDDALEDRMRQLK